MDQADILSRNDRVVFRKLAPGQGGVLLHLDTGAYFGLNETGAVLWELVDGRELTVDGLVDEFLSQVTGAPPEARAEIRQYLDALIDRGLLTAGQD